ncbi:Nn.00g085060.m01.CDS01 [Neocucurbitaria sp. VM-36]
MASRVAIVFITQLLHLTLALPQSLLVTPRAFSGCDKKAFLPGVTQYRFGLKSSGKDRSYSYHLPSSYNANNAYPIVIGFHGSSSIGTFLELDTKMSEARYSGEKIMIYPNGVGGSWAGPTYHTGSSVQEDVQFVADLIDDVKGRFCVDDQKVYGVGMSNGGGFIGTLACDPVGSALFTAIAAHSGAFYTDVNGPANGCAPSKVLPLLEIHGAADNTVKYEGGQGDGGEQPPISSWLEWWAQRNDCSSKTEEALNDGKVHHYSWTCDGKTGLLQHYKIDDLGHCWADTEPNISQLTVPQGPSVIKASETVMKFFDGVAA